MTHPRPPILPGDGGARAPVERFIRVDHAGEYGAVRIYAGQLAVLGRRGGGEAIRHMAEQERRHLATFEKLMTERRVRPTLLAPLWHIAGFALGAGSALLGEKGAMAATAAVEDVIDEHYARQAEALGDDEAALREVILDVPTTAHILGGSAMGESAKTGVIDRQNRVFGYPGLYVVDGSMIGANLGVNPSLTITALAERAMGFVPPKEG